MAMTRFWAAAALACGVVPAAAEAQTWRQAARGDSGTEYIDTDSIVRSGETVRYSRETRLFRPDRVSSGIRYDTLAVDYRADCTRRTHNALRTTARLKGVTIISFTAEEAGGEDEQKALPGSVAEGVLNAVCDGEWEG